MIKRNLASIFITLSCILGIQSVEFSNISEPKEYWSLIVSSLIILASIILVFNTESKLKKNKE